MSTATVPAAAGDPLAESFALPQFRLQSGPTLPLAHVVYKTFGTLNAERSNAILYPTSYAAQHVDTQWLVGPGRILDSERYFIVIPNMFGNGLSTSPSNFAPSADLPRCPAFTHVDNVAAQRRLLRERFGIERLALVYGWSMGAQQALHWGALYPSEVERVAAVCGSAKTSVHNHVFLEGLRGALTADPAWTGDRFLAKPERGLRAFGRVYAGWALSQAFYREQMHLPLGYASLEDFLIRDWEASFLKRDASNLLSMIDTWQRSDISDNDLYRGDLSAALGAIRAHTLIMPGSHDLYFTPEDSLAEARSISHAEYRPIPSLWGHRAGNPSRNPVDEAFIQRVVAELLECE
ncbi:MAG: alpha/beta fold hydrolase [Planctomycetia bacterium]|nr:alpha/beta fold hydrolase [Planctomycetia bacterium]